MTSAAIPRVAAAEAGTPRVARRVPTVTRRRKHEVSGPLSWFALASAPLLWLFEQSGHLLAADRILAVELIATGCAIFLTHGGWRITAAGVYSLAAGVMAGASLWYWSTTTPLNATPGTVFVCALSVFTSSMLMYALFWRGTSAAVAATSDLHEAISPGCARMLGVVGAVLFVIGSALRHLHGFGTLPSASADVGVVLFSSAVVLSDRGGFLRTPLRLVVLSGVLLAYYLEAFSGYGRLRLVTLAAAVAMVAQYRRHLRIKALAIAALIPTLLVFGAIGQARSEVRAASTSYHAPVGGLTSLVNPLEHFGQLVDTHQTSGHGATFLAELVTPVPRSLWPHKPVQLGRRLAFLTEAKTAAASNLSVVTLIQGEWYFNFGWPGLLLMSLVVGFVIRWLDVRLIAASKSDSPERQRILGYVTWAVIIGSGTDLAWGGTATWVNRDLQRLFLLVPIIAWSLLTAAQRRSAYVARRPVARPLRPSMSWGVSLAGVALPAERPLRPLVASLPSIPELAAFPLVGSRRLMGRAAAFVVDEGLSSLQNFVVMFAALRELSISSLGFFALVYNGALLVESVLRSLILLPLSVRFAAGGRDELRRAGSGSLGAAVLLGLAVVVVGSVGGLALHGEHRELLVVSGLAVLALITQETWRVFFFTAGQPWRAAINDGVCLVVTVGLLGAGLVVDPRQLSAVDLLSLWTVGTAIGTAVGVIQTRLVPQVSRGWGWLAEHGRLGGRLAAAQGGERLAAQVAFIVIAAVAGNAALGHVSAARTLISPFTTLVVALATFATPEAARAYRAGGRHFRRYLVSMSVISAGALALFGLVLLAVPNHLGRHLVGPNWTIARDLLVPILVWTGANALRSGGLIGLQVVERGDLVLRLSAVAGVAMIAATSVGAATHGASGAAWAFVAVSSAGSLAYWGTFLRASMDARDATAASTKVDERIPSAEMP
jgi:O-antigen/teichoic acid export membrane protein